MKKKVLFVITKSNWGGAQRYVYDLATSLPKDTFDVAVALGGMGTTDAQAGLLEKRLAEAGVRTIFVKSFMRDISFLREWPALAELVHIFRRERPDVAHLNSSKAGGIGGLAARIAGVKNIIFTSHGLAFDEDRNIFARALIWFATWSTFLLSHKVITISKDNFQRAKHLPFCAKKIHLAHNGLNTISFLSREESRAELSKKMHATPPADIPWIGMLNELTRNKNVSAVIRAASILKQKGLDFIICMIGDGEERKHLEKLIADEKLTDKIHLVGFIPEGYRHLKAFDIFALSSIKEGLPYVLLEAGQAGCAVVASNIAGIPDIIDNNVSGFLTDPKNTKDIAEKLEKLITNEQLRKNLGEQLKKKVEKDFSLKTMVEQTGKLY